jgi:hypothetical protein
MIVPGFVVELLLKMIVVFAMELVDMWLVLVMIVLIHPMVRLL